MPWCGKAFRPSAFPAGSYISVPAIIQPMSYPRGFLVKYAEQIKKMVKVPVIVAGRINSPDIIEEVVKQGKADMVALGRALVCDPEFVVKMREGRPGDIRSCIACNQGCIDKVLTGGGVSCLLNARAGLEAERRIDPAARKKKVMVIGGGPAGMEASRVAALRGHRVLLVEKEKRLGGKVIAASKPPGKGEFINIAGYLESSARKLGVEIRLGEEDLERAFREFQPEAVIFAAGSDPVIPGIPGIDGEKAVAAEDILNEKADSGQRVVIVGGGLPAGQQPVY